MPFKGYAVWLEVATCLLLCSSAWAQSEENALPSPPMILLPEIATGAPEQSPTPSDSAADADNHDATGQERAVTTEPDTAVNEDATPVPATTEPDLGAAPPAEPVAPSQVAPGVDTAVTPPSSSKTTEPERAKTAEPQQQQGSNSQADTAQPKSKTTPKSAESSPWGTIAGAGIGCGVCGCLPDAIAVGGLVVFFSMLEQAIASGNCGSALVGAILGVIFGLAPALLGSAVSGVCTPCATTIAASVGAAMGGRPFWLSLLGGIPGIVVGVGGTGLIIASLTVLQDSTPLQIDAADPSTLPLYLVAGVGMALAGGPLALVGSIAADLIFAGQFEETASY